jgi:Ca2+ transporting ATPase
MKMKKENNLVRKLEASETMGGASEICTDKTGTLTKNKMTVQEFYTLEQVFDGTKNAVATYESLATKELLKEGVLFNCSARVEKSDTGVFEAKGNCTEVGLINFLMFAGVHAADELKKKDDRILEVIPFNSARKRACTVVRHPADDNKVRVFLKGAPEIVLDYCSSYFDKNGNVIPMNADQKKELMTNVVANNFAKKAFRTLLISYRDYSYDEYLQVKGQNNGFATEKDREALENQMTVIGIYALMDPLREEIVESAIKCRKAGINIRMVTGDNMDTAKAIALNAGILTEEEAQHEYSVMDGKTFREICGGLRKLEDPNDTGKLREEIGNKKVFRDVEKRLKVLARSTPEDKYMLVTGLKELQKVVAVTGDGTNDAPALKKADVGFAMGITGTEVAKEASDIILLDDNFASIVTAVKWGRNIYTNVRKFL